MAEANEGRSNWLANLTGLLAWFILVGGILYCVFQLLFVGFWSGLLLAVGVSVASVFLAIGLLALSHIIARLGSIEDSLRDMNKGN